VRGLLQCRLLCASVTKQYTVDSVDSGVFRIWQRGDHGERGARAYNRGSGGGAPSGIQGQSPWSGGQGWSPPEAETFFAFECSMETANSPIFLKFGNAKDHQTLLNFATLAGKWQKRTFSYKVACKKFSWSGQRGGGHRTVALSLNTPLSVEKYLFNGRDQCVFCLNAIVIALYKRETLSVVMLVSSEIVGTYNTSDTT